MGHERGLGSLRGDPFKKAWDLLLRLQESQAWYRRRDAIALSNDSLVKLILAVVEQRGELVYSALKLGRSLHERALAVAEPSIPARPAALGRKIAQLAPSLRRAGYEETQVRTSDARK